MNRSILIGNFQNKIATIENESALLELDVLIDEMIRSSYTEKEELPSHVEESITRAKKQLDNGEGIAHQLVMQELRIRYPEME
jgi:hypothetical protein